MSQSSHRSISITNNGWAKQSRRSRLKKRESLSGAFRWFLPRSDQKPKKSFALVPLANSVLLPKIRSERAAHPETLAKVLANITPPLPYSITSSVTDALDRARAKPNPILITGSLHFAGEVLAHLCGEPAAFEECAQ